MSKNSISVCINAGDIDRLNEIVSFPLKPNSVFDNWQEGVSSLAMSEINGLGEVIADIPSSSQLRNFHFIYMHSYRLKIIRHAKCFHGDRSILEQNLSLFYFSRYDELRVLFLA